MSASNDHDLERPGGPPGAYGNERFVLKHGSLLFFRFEVGIVDQHVRSTMFLAVLLQALQLQCRLFGGTGCAPDLTVGVRV